MLFIWITEISYGLQLRGVQPGYNTPHQPFFLLTYPHNLSTQILHRSYSPYCSHFRAVSDAAEPPFVLRKSSAAAADETADPSLPATG